MSKSITTIFTGHSLDITDIVAISGIMIETHQAKDWPMITKTIYLEIFCSGGVKLRHNAHITSFLKGCSTPQQKQEYDEALKELEGWRTALVNDWAFNTGKEVSDNFAEAPDPNLDSDSDDRPRPVESSPK